MRSWMGALAVLGAVGLLAAALASAWLAGRAGPAAGPAGPAEARDVAAGARLARPPEEAPNTGGGGPVERSPSSVAERREILPDGLVGYVLSQEDGAPIRDAWVELCGAPRVGQPPQDPRVLAEAGTDSSGRFVLPRPREPGSWVRATAPYGWALTDPWWLPVGDTDGAPPVFHLRALRQHELRIALTDTRTSEPVAHYVLGLRNVRTGTQLLVPTDERGHGESEIELQEGLWKLSLIDDPRLRRKDFLVDDELHFDATPQGSSHRLAIPVGPTWSLDLRGPPDLDPAVLVAFLRETETESEHGRPWESNPFPLRIEPLTGWPWVRFQAASLQRWIGQVGSLTLVVVDQGRTLRGEASVPATWGIHHQPLRVDLFRTGTLTVEVRDPASDPIDAARIVLRPLAGRSVTSARTGMDGHARFEGLSAGGHSLSVTHALHEPVQTQVLVEPGGDARAVLVLRRSPIAGAVEGIVIGGSRLRGNRQMRARTRIGLRAADGTGRYLSLPLEFVEQGEELQAAFRFEDVPAGEYRLHLSSYDPTAWWPRDIAVRPPASGLELREVPEGTLTLLEPSVIDRPSDRVLDRAWLWLDSDAVDPPLHDLIPLAGWVPVPDGGSFEWGLGAPDHLPRFGSEADLERENGFLTGRIALERGVGVRIDVVAADGQPCAGAEIVVDGLEVGATDAQGRYPLHLAELPRSVEVRHDGLVTAGSILEVLEQGHPVCEVRLAGG